MLYIFDMDGTLLDSMGYWKICNRKVLESYRYPMNPEVAAKIRVISSRDTSNLVEEAGLDSSDNAFARFLQYMDEYYATEILPRPGAREYLERLTDAGHVCVMASATPMDNVKRALDKAGLLKYFTAVYDTTSFGCGKGKTEFFTRLCALHGCAPEDSVLVEDSFYSMNTARKLGMHTIGIAEDVYTRTPGLTEKVKSVSDEYYTDFTELIKQ